MAPPRNIDKNVHAYKRKQTMNNLHKSSVVKIQTAKMHKQALFICSVKYQQALHFWHQPLTLIRNRFTLHIAKNCKQYICDTNIRFSPPSIFVSLAEWLIHANISVNIVSAKAVCSIGDLRIGSCCVGVATARPEASTPVVDY